MTPLFKNKTYDKLKFVALVLLPAAAAAYFSLAGVWDLPEADKVVGTATVVDTFLGILLGLSTSKYNNTVNAPDGELVVEQVDGEKYLGLGIAKGSSVEALASKDEIRLTVVDKTLHLPE
jgi:hypothetical protein